MFEQEYRRANDRIRPRQDLLKEMEKKWAAEAARPAEEERGKVVAFPRWARYLSMAAGILLCVGIGMGSMLLYSRSRGGQQMAATASREETKMTAEAAAAPEEEKILTETTGKGAQAPAVSLDAMLAALEAESSVLGMHRAADEAEVEYAVRSGQNDYMGLPENMMQAEANLNMEAAGTDAGVSLKGAAKTQESRYPAGQLLQREDLMAVFLPTLEQVRVVQYAQRKVTNVFSLTLRERGAQVKRLFWEGDEFDALRQREDETELLRFDASDWKNPKHRQNLSQSGAFLGAWEMDGRIFTLSLYEATEQEPLPWVNGARMDYDEVLLDSARPGDTFTVITVYEPGGEDGFTAQLALLTAARGAVAAADRLLLWTGQEETVLYVLTWDGAGLDLETEGTHRGTVLDAQLVGESFSLLLETEDGLELVTLDRALNEEETVSAQVAGDVRFAQVYEDGAMVLTDQGLHWLTEAGDSALDVIGDGFVWLSPDRGLVLRADGQLQVVDLVGYGLEARGTARISEGLQLLLEDTSRLAFDLGTGRLVIPAGQAVYPFLVSEAGELTLRGEKQVFSDHNEREQRELRVLLTEDRALIFYKAGVVLCNEYLSRLNVFKY